MGAVINPQNKQGSVDALRMAEINPSTARDLDDWFGAGEKRELAILERNVHRAAHSLYTVFGPENGKPQSLRMANVPSEKKLLANPFHSFDIVT